MLIAFFFFLCSTATGQIDSELLDKFYQFEPSDESEAELGRQKFLEDLVFEAGRHVLFPQLYSDKQGRDDEERNHGVKYYELKGQPEFEESYSNREDRSEDCQVECFTYKPVCGSDGKVYASECHMRKDNCGKNNVSRDEWSVCTGNHYLCPTRCLDLNEPVCGSDLKIYHNICLMRKSNCGKLLQKLPLTACYEQFSQEQQQKQCPDHCSPLPEPVCGSDGVIYFNECVMRMKTCKQGIVRVNMEGCLSVPKCPQVCLPLYDPVCGSDGSLYTNYCRMMQNNCGKEVKKMPLSFCPSHFEH